MTVTSYPTVSSATSGNCPLVGPSYSQGCVAKRPKAPVSKTGIAGSNPATPAHSRGEGFDGLPLAPYQHEPGACRRDGRPDTTQE